MRFRGAVLLSTLVISGVAGWRATRPPTRGRTIPSTAAVVPSTSSETIAVQGSQFRITGPFRHENLEVFVLHSEARDETDFLTLDEGLKDGSVVVSEKPEQQVNELQIENRSDRPLFVQVGDRLKGGKQDRIVGSSFVVAPRSGPQPIPSFCVEHNRWVAADGSMVFREADREEAAPQLVRAAALGASQGRVWDEVARSKDEAAKKLNAPNTNSTLNETLDSAEVKKSEQRYTEALGSVLKHSPDAVGVVFVVNGKVEEVDVYPGRRILGKIYPRLLASHAFQATSKTCDGPLPVASTADIASFLGTGEATGSRYEVRGANNLKIEDFDKKIQSETNYSGDRFFMVTGK
jgi:hypothetical protein